MMMMMSAPLSLPSYRDLEGLGTRGDYFPACCRVDVMETLGGSVVALLTEGAVHAGGDGCCLHDVGQQPTVSRRALLIPDRGCLATLSFVCLAVAPTPP